VSIDGRSIETLQRDLEHEKKNLDHRTRELTDARDAWDRAKFQYDNVRESVRNLQLELVRARLVAGDESGAAADAMTFAEEGP
jgi:predicted  nucleic acid-binding Zn-ribbon protein